MIISSEIFGFDIPFGCEGTFIAGANGVDIGYGQANTTAIVADCGEPGSAAVLCNDYVSDGYDDWFLPSRDELDAINANEAKLTTISNGWYVTSSQQNADLAWRVYFWPQPSLTEPEGVFKSIGERAMAMRIF